MPLQNNMKSFLNWMELNLNFSDSALEEIAEIAVEKDVGARGLKRYH